MDFPKYENSIVNLMSSLLHHYGASSDYNTIPLVDHALNKNYKHVLLVVLDGFGEEAVTEHLDETAIMRQNMVGHMQSVYPTTTTAAMTSYYSGISPAEHGWLGWSLYFRDYGAVVDIFPNTNSSTGQSMETKQIAYRELPFETVYEKIHRVQGGQLQIHTIKPEKINFPSTPNRHHPARDLSHCIKIMKKIMAEDKPSFTNLYWPEPDSTMHINGPHTPEVKDMAIHLNHWLESLCAELTDTLVLVSADHGQTNIEEEIHLELDQEFKKMLVIPPSVEGRCTSFFVKGKYKELFREAFESRFSDEFVLFSHEEAVEKQLFGKGVYHEKFDDFIGDFVACGIGHSLLTFKPIGGCEGHHYKGHHAGLSASEMRIPLIIIDRE